MFKTLITWLYLNTLTFIFIRNIAIFVILFSQFLKFILFRLFLYYLSVWKGDSLFNFDLIGGSTIGYSFILVGLMN
jgi:hypothetical protein